MRSAAGQSIYALHVGAQEAAPGQQRLDSIRRRIEARVSTASQCAGG